MVVVKTDGLTLLGFFFFIPEKMFLDPEIHNIYIFMYKYYTLYIMYRYIFIYLCIYKYINSQHSQEEKSVTQKHTGLTS